jgi:hypothetical protein
LGPSFPPSFIPYLMLSLKSQYRDPSEVHCGKTQDRNPNMGTSNYFFPPQGCSLPYAIRYWLLAMAICYWPLAISYYPMDIGHWPQLLIMAIGYWPQLLITIYGYYLLAIVYCLLTMSIGHWLLTTNIGY